MPADIFSPVGFADLPGWKQDNPNKAFEAFRLCAQHTQNNAYRSGSLGITFESFEPAYQAARLAGQLDAERARRFFEAHFVPCRIETGAGRSGFVTGFYEPEVRASRHPTDVFRTPLLRRPVDLVKVTDENRPQSLDGSFAFARRTAGGLSEYHDREAIEQGVLSGRGLEIAWLEDPVDAFFVHVQGAARLVLQDEQVLRITYAGKTGHEFTGPGKVLAGLGEIPLHAVTMQSIRKWFADNPDRINEILWQNRSYIFFREAGDNDSRTGPIAAAKVPLTAGRSLAVDRLLHTFGTPFYISAPALTAFAGRPFSRLMIAQDTGSAIVGPARGDLFAGSGASAGETAGVVRHAAEFFALVPKPLLQVALA